MAAWGDSSRASLFDAAVGSLVGGVSAACLGVGMGLPDMYLTTEVGILPVVGCAFVNVVKQYHSSFVPKVSANGRNIEMKHYAGMIKVDRACLAPEFDYDFTNERDDGEKYFRGGESYERPYGSDRFALKVKDQYDYDNVWLGDTGRKGGEWPVSYHGTGRQNAKSIAEVGFDLTKSVRQLYGPGIYSTPQIAVAKRFADGFEYKGHSYICILQNRVNPKYLEVIPDHVTRNGTYWLSYDKDGEVGENELIRPYGICIFKKD